MALPQAYRLRHRSDFDRVYRQGKRYPSKYLTLWVYWPPAIASPTDGPAPSPAPPKLGVSISRKVDKRSVVRNRLRRWLHGGLCQWLPHLPPGWLAVIGVHPTALECNYPKLLQELEQLLAVVHPTFQR